MEADKNSPKPIEVEYPEDVVSEKDFVLIEKSFQGNKSSGPSVAKRSTTAKSVMTAAGSAAGGAASTASAAGGALTDASAAMVQKKQARLHELHQTYSLIRAQPFTLAVVMKLNYVPPPPPPVEEEPVEIPET